VVLTYPPGYGAPYALPRAATARRHGGNELYFDSAYAGGGSDGTRGAPYTTLTALYALSGTGDLKRKRIRFKAGSVFNAPLYLHDVSNFVLESYDSGAKPLFDITIAVASPDWQADAQADTYYTTNANYGSAGNVTPYLDGIACEPRGSKAALLDVYENGATGATHQYTYWYDSGNARMYVHVPPGATIGSMALRRARTAAEETVNNGQNAILLETVTNAEVVGLQGRGGRQAVMRASTFAGLTVTEVDAYGAGGTYLGGDTLDLFNFPGPSRAAKSTGLVMTGCTGSMAGGNGLELAYLSGFTVQDCEFGNVMINAMEFWQSCITGALRRNKLFSGCVNLIRHYEADAEDHASVFEDIVWTNNVLTGRACAAAPHDTASPGGAGYTNTGPVGLLLAEFNGANTAELLKNYRFVNNTIVTDDAPAVYRYLTDAGTRGGGDGTFRFKNNLVILRQSQAFAAANMAPTIYLGSRNASEDSVYDRNVYIWSQSAGNFIIGAGDLDTTWANYLASWDGAGDGNHASNEDNSVLGLAMAPQITASGTMTTEDLRPLYGFSDAFGGPVPTTTPTLRADTADADYPADDFNGTARAYGTAGALEVRPPLHYFNGRGLPVAAVSTDDGHESFSGGTDTWSSAGTSRNLGTVAGTPYIYAISFPGVNIAKGTVVNKAILRLVIGSVSVGGDVDILAETPQATPAQWSSSHGPRRASRRATKATVTLASGTGYASSASEPLRALYIDITAIVNAVLDNSTNWESGDRLNLLLEAASGSSVSVSNSVRNLANTTSINGVANWNRPALLIC
jgi:hypothetical protein